MNQTKALRDAWERFTAYQSFILALHQRPDGDAIGSSLAIARVLRLSGKDVLVISEDGVPENYTFVPESDMVVTATDRRDFDVGALVDSEGIKRVGSAKDAIESAKTTACIDHHVPNGGFGEIRVVDSAASSTAELVVELLDANCVEIDQTMATQLMAGLVSDTGAFRFGNTTPRTLRIAARLTELGASPAYVAREVYESRSLISMKLLGKALDSLETDAGGKIIWASVTRQDMEDLGATDGDTESIVNLVRWVRGPKVAILFRESEPGSIRISLRSDGVDVNQVAAVFGGGGHRAASGCTIEGSLDEAKRQLIAEVTKWTES